MGPGPAPGLWGPEGRGQVGRRLASIFALVQAGEAALCRMIPGEEGAPLGSGEQGYPGAPHPARHCPDAHVHVFSTWWEAPGPAHLGW